MWIVVYVYIYVKFIKKYAVFYLNVECVECGKFYIYICSLAKCG